MGNKVSLSGYYDLLVSAPWFYENYDDRASYTAGRTEMNRIRAISNQSDAHRELLRGFQLHKFSGPHWGTDVVPCPERPKEEDTDDGS